MYNFGTDQSYVVRVSLFTAPESGRTDLCSVAINELQIQVLFGPERVSWMFYIFLIKSNDEENITLHKYVNN